MERERPPEERFDDALRAWAERPPRLSPTVAARTVAARVDQPRRHSPRLVWSLATAAAVALAAAGVALVQLSAPTAGSRQVGMVLTAPALNEGQVLIWLDDCTPLVMTYAAPEVPVR